MWQYHLVKFISKLLCLAPACVKKLFGLLLGHIAWLVTPRWRKNLAAGQAFACLGVEEEEARRIAKASVVKFGPMIVEVLCFPLLNKDNIKEKVLFPDSESLRDLLKEGKGVIIAPAHFGNWELLGAGLALYGYPLVSVAQKQKNAAMDRFINEYRSMTGEHVTYKTGVLEMVRMLDAGHIVGLISDQDGGADGVVVDFFGKPTSCPKGAAALARLKGAPIVLTLIAQRADGRHEVSIYPPIYVKRTKDREADIKETTAELMQKLEHEIRKNPGMWFWLHNRWKVHRDFYK